MIGLSLIIIISVYALILVWVGINFNAKNDSIEANNSPEITFSIVIPYRNEATMLPALAESLSQLNYPNSLLEIIFVNDHSEDLGPEWLAKNDTLIPFTCVHLNNGAALNGKKQALLVGINAACNNYIITIDADCIVHKDLLNTYNQNIVDTENLMVVGPVKYTGYNSNSFWQEYQIFENAGLVAIGSIAAQMGKSFLSNGANLCFHKNTFFEVGGYTGNEQIASGDDEFLLEKYKIKYPNRIGFLQSSKAIVSTPVQPNLLALINQRVRWAEKSRYKKNKSVFFLQILTVALYLSIIIYLLNAIFSSGNIQIALSVLAIKILGDMLFYLLIKKFFGIQLTSVHVTFSSLCQLIVTPMVGFIALSGKFSWKGRKY